MRGIVLVAIAATLLAAVAACGSGTADSSSGREAFATTGPFMVHIDEYQALEDSPRAVEGERALSGKAIFIDVRQKRVAWDLVWPLDDARSTRLAYSPGEVAVVVLMTQRDEQVGVYTGGGKAYVPHVTLTVIDVASRKVLARKTFVGGQPPSTATMGMSASGPLPVKKMLAWFETLPTR
jgi:hypothetical protein